MIILMTALDPPMCYKYSIHTSLNFRFRINPDQDPVRLDSFVGQSDSNSFVEMTQKWGKEAESVLKYHV